MFLLSSAALKTANIAVLLLPRSRNGSSIHGASEAIAIASYGGTLIVLPYMNYFLI